MNKVVLILILLFGLNACALGPRCTYTQEGTKISSWFWITDGEIPVDLSKENCS